jgi:hypothetical protein
MSREQNVIIQVLKFGVRTFWFLLLCSCLSPVDFETDNVGGKLVVSGQISTLSEQNFVQLGRTADSERLPFSVSNATVRLVDDLGQSYIYQEDGNNPGMYHLPDVAGTPERTYFIQVSTFEGEYYESAPEKMPSAPGELSARYEIVREEFIDNEGILSLQPFIKIYINSVLPTTSNIHLKWSTYEAFLLSPTDFPDPFGSIPPPCFIVQPADPQRIVLFNGDDVQTKTIENLLVASRIVDWSFLEKHHFTIYQSGLTRDALEYWRKVNISANQVGSIFDTPAAEIKGNIKNVNKPDEKVYGYFQAVNEKYYRITLYQQDIPYPMVSSSCTFDNRDYQSYPMRCLDCLSVRNSSYTRPPWF